MPNKTRLTDERKVFEEWFRKEHGWYEEPLSLQTGEWNAYRAATRAALERAAVIVENADTPDGWSNSHIAIAIRNLITKGE
jgi:hypothetical protein